MACEMLLCQRSWGCASWSLVPWDSMEVLLLVYRLFGTTTCDTATESKQARRVRDSHRATFKLIKHHLTQIRTRQSSRTNYVWCVKVWSGSVRCLGYAGEWFEADTGFPLVLPCPFASPDAERPVTARTAALQHQGAGWAAAQRAARPSNACPAAAWSFPDPRTAAFMC